MSPVVACTALQEITKTDCVIMSECYKEACSPAMLTRRVVKLLENGKGFLEGSSVDLYDHGLQAATRAERDGANEEMIVCALLQHIGKLLSVENPGDIPAGILKPYITQQSYFILRHHENFQKQRLHKSGKTIREIYQDSPYYEATIDFYEKYDAPSFDPNYDSFPIEHFIPIVERIFSRPPFLFYKNHPKKGLVTGAA